MLNTQPENQKFKNSFLMCVLILIILLGLQGCERHYHIKANYLSGYLHTPWGKYEFKPVSSADQAAHMRLHAPTKNWRGFLYADAGDIIVILSLHGQRTSFLAHKESKYGGTNYDLSIKSRQTKQTTEDNIFISNVISFDVENRSTMVTGFDDHGGTAIRKLPGGILKTPYNIYLPFKMSGDDFTVDVKVKTTREGSWEPVAIGVPAH